MNTVDLVACTVLLAFVLWGVWRGALRPLLMLLLLAAAFGAATAFYGSFTDIAGRVTGLSHAESEAAAWAAVGFGALVLGSALLAFVSPWATKLGAGGVPGRLVGGVLGGAFGLVVIVAAGYVTLGWPRSGAATTPLSRTERADESGTDGPGWTEAVAGARAGAAVRRGGELVRGSVPLPRWVSERMASVDRDLASVKR